MCRDCGGARDKHNLCGPIMQAVDSIGHYAVRGKANEADA